MVYTGSVPDLFQTDRDIVVDGQLRNGTFVATPGSMVTKCPSKYSAAKPQPRARELKTSGRGPERRIASAENTGQPYDVLVEHAPVHAPKALSTRALDG